MSTIQEIHVGDIGTQFDVTLMDYGVDPAVAVDLTGATTLELVFVKPDGTKVTKTATIVNAPGVDGLIRYTIISGDLDVTGIWRLQAHIVSPAGEWRSNEDRFIVKGNL